MLELFAFGRVRARLDGSPVDLGGPRQRAVLGLLMSSGGRTVSTDRFLDELWQGEPPPSATGALQAYVSRLRALLEPHREKRRPATVLVSSPPGYALSLPSAAVDTWRFSHLVRTASEAAGIDDELVLASVDQALGLWADDPFAEYLDQDWARSEAARLADLHALAVEVRGGAALRLGRGGHVVAQLEEYVRLHPLREQAVALLARAFYQAGRQADALDALSSLRVRLVDELGVDPSPELRDLEAAILRQASHLAAPAPSATPGEPAAAPEIDDTPFSAAVHLVEPTTLVGRDAELARLAAARASVGTRARIVWVEGDAGFGKSALVQRFGDESVGQWFVVRGHCSEVPGAPAGYAWREVLEALGAQLPSPMVMSAFEVADALRDLLESRGTPTLILLEDVHRADDDTLQALWHVVESTAAPVLVVATFRSHEISRDLAATLALTAERTIDRIMLGGLNEHGARQLLSGHVGATLPDAVWNRLVERAAGNPLFLRQLAQLVASEGAEAADALPAAIRDLLLRRIERLPESTVEVLSRASVLGRDIDFDLLLALEQTSGDPDEETLANHLDTGLVAGLLESPRPNELRFSHVLVHDTFYSRLPPLRRTRLHRAALAAYQHGRSDCVEEMAHHATASLDRRSAAGAVPILLAAAERASYAGAVPHLKTALWAQELADSEAREQLAVRLELVRALARHGDTVAAMAERSVAIRDAATHGTDADVARAWQWQTPMMWSRSSARSADPSTLAELWSLLDRLDPDDLPARIELLNAIVVEADPWNLDEVVRAADEMTTLAEKSGDPELRCRALNAAFFAVNARRDPRVLEQLGAQMLAIADDHHLHGYAAVAHMMLQSAAIGRADLPAAEAHIEAAVRAGTSGQLEELLFLSSIFESTRSLLAGDLEAAREGFERVTAQIAQSGDPNGASIWLYCRFAVDFAAGDTSPLGEHTARLLGEIPWYSNDLHIATLIDAGQIDAARDQWRPKSLEHDATWLFNIALRAWICHELDDVDRARLVYQDLEPWSGHLAHTLNGALALGPVDHYLGLLAMTLGDPSAASRHFDRASTLTGADGASTWDRRWVRTPGHLLAV